MSERLEDGCRQLRNVRVADALAQWAQDQARERGVGLGLIVEDALRLLRDRDTPKQPSGLSYFERPIPFDYEP